MPVKNFGTAGAYGGKNLGVLAKARVILETLR